MLCDDLGYGDLGVLFQNSARRNGDRSPTLHTPRLDKMAADGVVLTGMYCPAPVCAPSRASLLTGTTQGHCDLRDNAFDRQLQDGPNLASMLKEAGYATAAVGKWGLQGQDPLEQEQTPRAWPGYPTRRGFDEFFGYVRHGDGHEHYPVEGLYRGPKEVWHNDDEVSADLAGCYTTDLFTAFAKQWIGQQVRADAEQPFFLYLAYDTPHAVLELPTGPYPAGSGLAGGLQWTGRPGAMINTAAGLPDSFVHPDYRHATFGDPEAEQQWPDVYKRYATAVRRIDDCVGDLLALLADVGVDEETLVIFTSDNGPSIESYLDEPIRADFFRSFGPFDGIKRDCWEGGVRVGALVRAPGLIPGGRIDAEPAQFHDLLATFADLADIAAPARSDGVSLAPTLLGSGSRSPSTLYVEYAVDGRTPAYAAFAPAHRGRQRGQMQLVRMGDHVGVRYDVAAADDRFEVYDVARDPKQEHDLADTRPDLHDMLAAQASRVRRAHPEFPRPYDGEAMQALPATDAEAAATEKVAVVVTEQLISRDPVLSELPWTPTLAATRSSSLPRRESVNVGEPVTPDVTAQEWTGELVVPAAGLYDFDLVGIHHAVLRVHDAVIVDEGSRGSVRLAAGQHPFRLSFRGAVVPRLMVRHRS
ncbi:arylsulfatase [Kribbella aluminosa]